MRRSALLLLFVAACTSDPNSEDSSSAPSTSGSTVTATGNDASGAPTSPGSSTSSGADTNTPSTGPGDTATETSGDPDGPPPYEARGPYGVGLQTVAVTTSERELRTTVWYPTETADGSVPLASLVATDDADTLSALMAAAPAECVRPNATATLDAPLAEGRFATVMFSHCLSCLGISSSFIAERLASHGVIVIGVTHSGDTLFEQQDGVVAPLDGDWLEVRVQDVRGTFEHYTSSRGFADAIDLERVGMFGHSYGATTTGKVLQDDDRFIAGVAMAAPVENPLLPGVSSEDISQPMLFLLAEEDNSIQAVGNNLIRANAAALGGPSWLVELADAGHWSMSDLCGLIDAFEPGCGSDTRQTVPGERFTYLDPALARNISAAYVTAFFALHLQGDSEAADYLGTASPGDVVTVTPFPR